MRYPRTIKEVENLEARLQKRRIDPNCYWHLTTGMKIAIAEEGDGAKKQIAKLMRELKETPKIPDVKSEKHPLQEHRVEAP